MKQLTIRGVGAELDRRLRALAREKRLSLNKAAVELMRQGAGLSPIPGEARCVGDALDAFVGRWSKRDEAQLRDAVKELGRIDAGMWR